VAGPSKPTPLYHAVAVLSWPLLRLLFRYRASGRELLPTSGGYVLAAGHVSNLDPWPLAFALWPHRFVRFMAKAELFWFPLTLILNGAGGFKVHRGRSDREALERAVELAREGYVIAMFPEGTRRRKGLRKRREAQAHTGAARIALEAGVPLVPAGIKGTNGLRRLERWRVRYGAPVDTSDGPTAQEATERLMARIHELEASL
jgi:1-acyl-sn-glycerol-3-phosphate acyltransferase